MSERGGAAVVLGEQRADLVDAVAGAVLDERADLEVLPCPHRLGQHAVGHVPDQHVLERQLALARETAFGARRKDVLLLQRGERPPQVAPLGARQRHQRSLPERAPDHSRLLDQPPLERIERVEARGQHALDGVWQLGCLAALLGDAPRHLLREQRVAARPLHHRGHERPAARQKRRDERLGVGRAQRVEDQLGRRAPSAAPARTPVEQLVAREADDQERSADPLSQVLDRVEHAVVRPVDVLEREHERLLAGPGLDAGAEGREERVSHALRVVVLRHQLGRHLETDQAAEQGRRALALLAEIRMLGREQLAGVVEQLAPRHLGRVAVDYPTAGADDLAERPEHDARAVRQAAAGVERGCVGAVTEPPLELAQHARLAHAGLSHERDQVWDAVALDPLVYRLQGGQLVVPPDQRRLARRRRAPHRLLGGHAHGLPRRNGLRLALELERLECLVAHGGHGGSHRALANGHAAGPRRALQPGGHVHGVAGHRVAGTHGAGEHLAGVHAHAQVEVDAGREALVHLVHGGLHAEAGAHGALGVVLVRHGRAEDRHHVVADVLVDGAAVALDLLAEPHQGAVDERLHGLWVHALGHGGVAGQVGEEDGHLAAFLRRLLVRPRSRGSRRGDLVELRAAAHAEARLWGRGRAAARAAALEPGAARHAECRAGRILRPAAPAAHRSRLLALRGWTM